MEDILKRAVRKRNTAVTARRCWLNGTKDVGPWFDIAVYVDELGERAATEARTGEYETKKERGFRTQQVPVVDEKKRMARLLYHLVVGWGGFKVRDLTSFLPIDDEIDPDLADEPVDFSEGNRMLLAEKSSFGFYQWVINEATDLAAYHAHAERSAVDNFRGARTVVVTGESDHGNPRVDEPGVGGKG